jgi:hypothetical protein
LGLLFSFEIAQISGWEKLETGLSVRRLVTKLDQKWRWEIWTASIEETITCKYRALIPALITIDEPQSIRGIKMATPSFEIEVSTI